MGHVFQKVKKGFSQLCESQTIKKVILNNYEMWKYTSVFLFAIFVLIFCDRVFTHFSTTEKCKLRQVEKVSHNKTIVVVCTIINVLLTDDKICQLKDQIWTLEIFSQMEKLNNFRSLHLSYKSFETVDHSHSLYLFLMNQCLLGTSFSNSSKFRTSLNSSAFSWTIVLLKSEFVFLLFVSYSCLAVCPLFQLFPTQVHLVHYSCLRWKNLHLPSVEWNLSETVSSSLKSVPQSAYGQTEPIALHRCH